MPILRPEERVGSVINERYRLDRILGKGGMGVVFAGTHTWTNRAIAVKLLLPQYAEDSAMLQRFFQEARAAAALEHPHVIDVLDMGEDDEGMAFIVLEYLDGEPLSALLKRERAIDYGTLLEIVLPVLDALAEAHARGILHRDLKPDNVFVAKGLRGRKVPKLLDFGIAKLLESQSMATGTGSVLGTPHFMAPEQARGDKDLDGRADVWSMGVVCYQALAGKLPFNAETPTTVLVKIMTEPAPPLRDIAPDVHPAIAAVVDRALAPSRDDRIGSMAALMTALIDAARDAGIELDARLLEYRDREAPVPPATRPSAAGKPPAEAFAETVGSGPSKATIDARPPKPAVETAPTLDAQPAEETRPLEAKRDVAVEVPATRIPTPSPMAVPPTASGAVAPTPEAGPSNTSGAVAPTPVPTLVPAPTAAPKNRGPWLIVLGVIGAVGVLLIGGVGYILSVTEDFGDVEVVNHVDEPIQGIYLRRTGSTSWGNERLAGRSVPPGRSATLPNIRCASYDVRLVGPNGIECTMMDRSICPGLAFEVNEADMTCSPNQ
ncbi:MAG: protein kinase [Deltaproteobacteria bacterium]|nr:protein kinase [Deltaproteobacteria bacterium]